MTLPPLNRYLARGLIQRTRVVTLLGAFRNRPSVDMDARAHLTQLDYSREMALLALTEIEGREVELGVARGKGVKVMEGEVLKTNHPMLKLVQGLGFRDEPHPEDNTVRRISRTVQKHLCIEAPMRSKIHHVFMSLQSISPMFVRFFLHIFEAV